MLVMFLLGAVSCASTPSEPEEEATAVVSESWQVGEHWRYSPQSIWGDTLIAGEYIYGTGLEGQYITAYNLQTREKRRIREIPADYLFEEPSIHEDKVVWSSAYYSEEARMSPQKDFDALNWDIFLLDLQTGEVRQITTDEHAQIRARIYGDTIVWLDNRHEEHNEYPHYFDVYAYDLKTGEERRITTTNSIRERDLSISNSVVLWTDSRNDDPSSRINTYPPVTNNDIYLYDLATNRERRVTTDPGDDSSPAIDNGRIVWRRSQKVREADIFLYDIQTGQETQISKSRYAAGNSHLAIYGNRIVWADARISWGNTAGDVIERDKSGAAEIYLYDLGTGKETLLVPSTGTEFTTKVGGDWERKIVYRQVWMRPVMYGDYVVYALERQIGSIVYAMKLDDK